MFLIIIELIGTIAFAASGAMVAINKKMDVFGVAMLGLFTSVGGGIIRDVLIGVVPPSTFQHPEYGILGICVSIITFLPPVRRRVNLDHPAWVLIDSIGLGVFVVIGVQTAMRFDNFLFEICLGTITGVGGGVLRDICAREMPMIFVRHFYACACIIGAAICALIYPYSDLAAMIIGAVSIIILRLFAAKYKWHLPKA